MPEVAVITGAAGGIARALTSRLQKEGTLVAGLDLVDPDGCDVKIRCDVTSSTEVDSAIARVHGELGAITQLVCAAGVVSESPVEAMSLEEWQRVVNSSLTGSFLVSRAAIPHLREAENGRIVAVSSGYATKGYRHGAHYAAAKAGIEALVKSLALELAESGVTVNAVAPGPVVTEMYAGVADAARVAETERLIPLGRVATPGDVVGLIAFLLGPAAGYITGQVIHVNGGMLMP